MRLRDPGELVSPLWRRLAWMAAIWALSVAALGLVGFVLKLWLK